MMKKRFISGILATLMLAGQFAWTAAAAAEETPTPTPTTTESVSPTPSETVTPTPTEAPATATPTPEVTLTPTPEAAVAPVTVSPTVSPTATPATESATVATPEVKADQNVTGANGCGGVIPNWVFDTVSRTWLAADKSSFSCDKASGYYLSPKYYFDKRIGWYEIIPESAPKPDYMITAPNVVHTVLGDLVVGSQDYQVAKALGLLDGAAGSGILMPGGGSAAATASGTTAAAATPNQSWFDLTNLVNVVNVLQSNATSGSVAADSNTQVGNVGSGAANVVANLINLLASAWSWSNGSLSFFMQNILAPLTGDINLNPTVVTNGGGGALGSASIAGTGDGSTNTIDINNPNSLEVTAKSSGSITNNVEVNAASGDATADKNTQVGNVSTGMATAQVNIINLINSFISSGSSFFGILNIFGNLNGDILFPKGFLDGLVPAGAAPASTTANISGTGTGSNNQLGVDNSASATINNSNLNTVNNNVLTTAASGAVNADANTVMGGANSGAASTNQSLFNLSNSSIFGDNAVLVMVNVLGHWVGKIMTLPGTGLSQSALLTGGANVASNTEGPQTTLGISGTGADSTNQTNIDNSSKTNVDQQSVGTITNNVTVGAQSGNATATKNTEVGNISTGDAKAGASVANLFNTVMNVKHWFGVLVINVFGDWTGDVNNDTAAGGYSRGGHDVVQGTEQPVAAVPTSATKNLLALNDPPKNAAKTHYGAAVADRASNSTVAANEPAQQLAGKVLTAAAQSAPAQEAAAAAQSQRLSFLFIASALIMMVAGALLTIEKKLRH